MEVVKAEKVIAGLCLLESYLLLHTGCGLTNYWNGCIVYSRHLHALGIYFLFWKGSLSGKKTGNLKCKFVHLGGIIEAKGIMINAVPAYIRLKSFHTRGKGYVGYVVAMDDVGYYVAGDSDMTPENQDIKCDVALIPVGGKYTMDCRETAKFVNHNASLQFCVFVPESLKLPP